MTVIMTMAPRYPLLTALLWAASAAVYARGTCHLAVALVRNRPLGRVLGWQAGASGLVSATAVCAGWWQAGVFFAVMAGACAVACLRERNNGKVRVTQ